MSRPSRKRQRYLQLPVVFEVTVRNHTVDINGVSHTARGYGCAAWCCGVKVAEHPARNKPTKREAIDSLRRKVRRFAQDEADLRLA